MKTPLTAIPRPAILFALALLIGTSSLAIAGDPDDLGSFEDILVVLDSEPQLAGPALNGPAVTEPALSGQSVIHSPPALPVQHGGLTMNGPVETLTTTSEYPAATETQSVIETQIAPEQIQNPFLDFETVETPPTGAHAAHEQYALPPQELPPTVFVPRKTSPRIAVPAKPVPSLAIKPPTTIVKKTIVTTTIVPKSVKPTCPYERAQRQRQLERYPEPGYQVGIRTGYIPYGGRGLDRDFNPYDRYRGAYGSRWARQVPVYRAPYPSGYRNYSRSSHFSGRGGFSIGLRF